MVRYISRKGHDLTFPQVIKVKRNASPTHLRNKQPSAASSWSACEEFAGGGGGWGVKYVTPTRTTLARQEIAAALLNAGNV